MSEPVSIAPTAASVADPACGFWGSELAGLHDEAVRWLWHGYLAAGNVTLLTSQWKSGKTTLVSLLLSRLKAGGTLAGLPVLPGRAVVVSEESRAQWQLRHGPLDFSHVFFICRPFRGKPTFEQWQALLAQVMDVHRRHGLTLLVIDTLATFLPGHNEASAACMLDALLPLQDLTRSGLAVLLSHHPRKGDAAPGQAARGTGALTAFVDILLEMNWCTHATEEDRRRRILAFSRYPSTPRQLVLELNPEATDYLVRGDFHEDEFLTHWDTLRTVLEDADAKKTRPQLLTAWPEGLDRPADATLYRWLTRAVSLGLVCQQGTGRAHDPFRYWLPAQEAKWKEDPLYELNQQIEESKRVVLEQMRVRRR